MTDTVQNAGSPRPAPGAREWLLDPFTYIAGGRSLAVGVAAILLAGLVGSWSTTHFDGVLDFHTGRPAAPWVFPSEGLIDWVSLATVLFVLGKLVSRTAFRAIDLFGTQAMARWPTVIMAAGAMAPPYRRYVVAVASNLMGTGEVKGPAIDPFVFGAILLVSIIAAIWMIALMYRSYSICCNFKGAKAIATFISGLLVAEVVSKLVLLHVILR